MKHIVSWSISDQAGNTAERGFTITELLVALTLLAIVVLFLVGASNRTTETARTTSCLSQLRQLHQATIAFAYDRGGILPDSKVWQANAAYPGSLAPYLALSNDLASRTSPSILTCKTSHSRHPSPRDYCRTYSINIYAAGSVDGVLKPYQLGRLQLSRFSASQALYMDGPASIADNLGYYQTSASPSNIAGAAPFLHPHRDSMNVVYLDGHAATLNRDQVRTVLPDGTQPFWIGNP